MKKLIIIFLSLIFSSGLVAQTTETEKEDTDKFQNVKMLKSEQSEEVQIEIRKPDNASLMPRKVTDFENTAQKQMIKKIKNSNKMLY
ncbi:MAG: hypothetical protein Q7J16_07830 [Candidatus Cloacimonadales bacterium]|nr:hypothetical protein [Candidatus Cloacimonadales bacterium]